MIEHNQTLTDCLKPYQTFNASTGYGREYHGGSAVLHFKQTILFFIRLCETPIPYSFKR